MSSPDSRNRAEAADRTDGVSSSQIEWTRRYDGHRRLAGTPERLTELLHPARAHYRAHDLVPDWCGVDLLRGWAFHLAGSGAAVEAHVLDELDAVTEALRRHPAAEPQDRPPADRPRVTSDAVHADQLPVEFSDRPKMHRHPDFLSRKQTRLWEPHVAPINSFVERIRAEHGSHVPYIDPDSGGVLARVLFVLESPAKPAAHGSGMLSADNDDDTAANMWTAYRDSGLPRTHGLHWNAVPWYIGDGVREKNVTRAQVRSGQVHLRGLLELAPGIRVVVALGKPAQESLAHLQPEFAKLGVTVLACLHPSPRNNARGGRERLLSTFREAIDLIRGDNG